MRKRPTQLMLPSGQVIPVRPRKPDPRRPWESRYLGNLCDVVRPRRGDSTPLEIYTANRMHPVVLEETDAQALAAALNQTAE